jgi:hypothetical protein
MPSPKTWAPGKPGKNAQMYTRARACGIPQAAASTLSYPQVYPRFRNLSNTMSTSWETVPSCSTALSAMAATFSIMQTDGRFAATYFSADAVVAPLACKGSVGQASANRRRLELQREIDVHMALTKHKSTTGAVSTGSVCTSG